MHFFVTLPEEGTWSRSPRVGSSRGSPKTVELMDGVAVHDPELSGDREIQEICHSEAVVTHAAKVDGPIWPYVK